MKIIRYLMIITMSTAASLIGMKQSLFTISHTPYQPWPFQRQNFTVNLLTQHEKITQALAKQGKTIHATSFEILDVSPSATPTQIKDRYRALAKKFHPDQNKQSPTADTEFSIITQAKDAALQKKAAMPFNPPSNVQHSWQKPPSSYQPYQWPVYQWHGAPKRRPGEYAPPREAEEGVC